MSNLKKHPWFRFHLLTAIVMLIAAGVALSMNMRRTYDHERNGWRVEWGWPLRTHVNVQQPVGTIFNEYVYTVPFVTPQTDWGTYAFNASFAISTVVALGALTESLIRRREARKT